MSTFLRLSCVLVPFPRFHNVRLSDETSIRYYLSERFRLRFEDAGIEEMIEDVSAPEPASQETVASALPGDTDHSPSETKPSSNPSRSRGGDSQTIDTDMPLNMAMDTSLDPSAAVIRTLDGEIAGDEMEEEARNYQILLEKIETLLIRLRLDA